jgi:hypothetical protein
MVEKRHNDKPVTATSNKEASAPAPTLEQRIANALTGDLPSAELGELLTANDAAIIAAEQAATAAKEYAYDPVRSPNIAEARECMENTALLVGRLQTLRPRLLTKFRERYLQEQAAEWRAASSELIGEGNELADELREVYAASVGKIVDVFVRISDFKKRRDACYSTRPDKIGDQLPDPELLARNLNGFTITTTSLLEQTKLFDFETGTQLWPPAQLPIGVVMAQSVQAMAASQDREQFSPNWWRAAARRAAAHKVETERQDARLREMERAQAERENLELKEHFVAAHGLGVK